MTRRSRRATDVNLAATLETVDIAMVCGSGGVGKTSIAAAMAVSEAMRGRKVCVLTIDPARRLADAMGLTTLDDRERKVKLPPGAASGGELWALMLDPKKALDRLVAETAPDEEAAERIYGNRVYQQMSANTAGMQEYMALERLYEIDRAGRYDLVVVDTPPAAHARELLDSPHRILRFLEGRSLRWFLKPGLKMGKFGLRAIGGPGGAIVGLVQKVTGVEMLRDTTEFFESMDGMYEGFSERIKIVERLFSDERTGFFIVTSPERESIFEAIDFWSLLAERDFSFVGAVVNRVEPFSSGGAASVKELRQLPGFDANLARDVHAAQVDHLQLAKRDNARIDQLEQGTGGARAIAVPRLARLVTDIEGLTELTPYLYGTAE